MKRLVIGILAHVDAGKTTLSEGLLYNAGMIAKLGRVDRGDAFLDTDSIERERGITIFSKQAVINAKNTKITLLDTPGHVDFSAETERTLQVLDYAVLVISGADRVQSHTETLWRLLEHYGVPVFLFINKMDLDTPGKNAIIQELSEKFGDGFAAAGDDFFEEAAFAGEELFGEYSKTGSLADESIADAVASRKLFPCFFGSALKNEGVAEFLDGIDRYTKEPPRGGEFGARIYKVAKDSKGQRLCYMKVCSGVLRVKDIVRGSDFEEKVNEIRIYSGEKYQNAAEVFPGEVCAVCGLSKAAAGDGIGTYSDAEKPMLEPVFSYSLRLAEGADIHKALAVLHTIEEEETQLHVSWNERQMRINVRLMGDVQMEVLKRILEERFGLSAEFEPGSVVYKETIKNTVEGVGHYEPLRHYAEVHLLIEPQKAGSGVKICSKCSEDVLDRNWQRLILTHIAEKTHLGVLTGSPLTDVKITLINGRAHKKHTEGGDFRQATYRAVRQGLMQADSVLLEPWYSFSIEVPTENVGRVMTDMERIGAEAEAPVIGSSVSRLCGMAPVEGIRDYQRELTAFTRGRGKIRLAVCGYFPCKNQEEIVAKIGYDCESDVENTADSIFCSHGGGYLVRWNEVFEHMHIPLLAEKNEAEEPTVRRAQRLIADEEELLRIFEMTYGKVKRKSAPPLKTAKTEKPFKAKPMPQGEEYLLIDGYNIIFAWEDLKKIADESLDDARKLLCDKICSYQAMRKNNVIIVFDAYKVKGMQREVEKIRDVSIVYTKEAETADAYIEKATKKLCRNNRVRVATSDNLEQVIIFGHGARRVSARELFEEVSQAEEEIREFIRQNNSRISDLD